MNRRKSLQAIAAMAASAGVVGLDAQTRGTGAPAGARGILLHCDLEVDPAREQEMLKHFHSVFVPAAAKFEGYIDVKILKLRTTIQGRALPPTVNYRFQLTYQSEELRQKWIASDVHTKVWMPIENMLTNKQFQILLFDTM